MGDIPVDMCVDTVMDRMRDLYQEFARQHEDAWIHSDLSMAQVKAFFVIAKDGEPSVGLVAKELNIGLSSASQVVERLVKAGLVERRPHPHDRRVMQCVLSRKGQKLREQSETGSDMVRAWLKRIDKEQLAALATGLTALAEEAARSRWKGEDMHGR